MKNYNGLFWASMVLLLVSCGSNSGDFIVLDIDKALEQHTELNLSSIAQSVRYVALETDSDMLIDDQSICGLYVLEDGILLADKNQCSYFDPAGKFVRQIGRKGRGPGEYSSINQMKYDKTNAAVYISDRSKRGILKYDLAGNYLETIIPKHFATSWYVEGDKVALNVGNMRGNNPRMMILLSEQGDTLKVFPNYDRFVRKGGPTLSLDNQALFYECDHETRYLRTFNDTLYTLMQDSLSLSPCYVFKTLSHALDANTRADVSAFINSEQDYLLPWSVVETEGYLFVQMLRNKQGLWPFVFDKKKQAFYAVSQVKENRGYTNDLDEGMPFFPSYKVDEKTVCAVLSSYKIVAFDEEHQNRQSNLLKRKITEDSNPVLMIVTLR